jgi:outer membrane protein assembly factor BamB
VTTGLWESSGTATVYEGNTQAATFGINLTMATVPATPVFVDMQYDHNVFASGNVGATVNSNRYYAELKTKPNLSARQIMGNVSFRLCQEAACTHVYPNSSITYAYTINVRLQDWPMYQRDAAHTGYVPATLDATKFSKAWTWNHPDGGYVGSVPLHRAISDQGNVYVTTDADLPTSGSAVGTLVSISEFSGNASWRYPYNALGPHSFIAGLLARGGAPSMNEDGIDIPTYYDGLLINPSASYFLLVPKVNQPISVSGGRSLALNRGAEHLGAIFENGKMYFSEGTTSQQVTALGLWTLPLPSSPVLNSNIPALDGNYLYQYTGASLVIVDKATGSLVATIADPNALVVSTDYYGAPIVSGNSLVVAYSGTQYMTTPISEAGLRERKLVAFDIASRSVKWASAQSYTTTPATANNVIYAGHNGGIPGLDALSTTDGHVLWSWTPPTGEQFHWNIVVTDNLVFVSTDKNVYAIDLTTHQTVWSANTPGAMTLGPDFFLFVVTGATQSDGNLVAYKLN